MSIKIETRRLTKKFGSFTAVSDVSLDFAPGLIHAVLGENGAGKSTLMKLLFGLHQPTDGEILIDGQKIQWRSSMDAINHGLGMVQQHFSLVDTLSAIDNIMLGAEVAGFTGALNREKAIERLEGLLPSPSLKVPWHVPVSELNVGEKQRVEILKLLFRESKVLFLDEPTAVLTPAEIEDFFDVLRKLKASGRTIVLITHKINEVMQVCDTYSVLRQGQHVTSGEVASASVEKIVESMIGRKILDLPAERKAPHATTVFECRDLAETSPTRGALKGIHVQLRAGEIVGIAGVEGSGQSHLVEAIMGLRDFSGELKVLGHQVAQGQTRRVRDIGVGLIPEDRHHQGLWLEESCFSNLMIGLEDHFVKSGVFQENKIQSETSIWAKEYDVRAPSLSHAVGSLSGGNQQKVIFAREVSGRDPKFLICHQPTRGVDLGAIDLIHRKLLALRDQGLGILILSSELDEIMKLSDRLYVFFEGRVSAEFSRPEFDRMKIGSAMTGVVHG